MYWDAIDHHLGSARLERFWLAHPRVRASVNRTLTGNPERWPLEWFRDAFESRLPVDHALVLGCGTGALERDLVGKKIVSRVTAVDIAPEAVRYAADRAGKEGMADAIEYVVADIPAFLREREEMYDAIFFHGALHHLAPVDDVLALVSDRLKAEGLLYIDEYVGPSMQQWRWWRLIAANLAWYLCVPRRLRRPRLVRAPRNPADPTEMIDSASIIPSLRRRFAVLAERGYGGNIVGIVYPNLRHDVPAEQLDRAVQRLLHFEQAILRVVRHHHAVVVAAPRAIAVGSG